MGKTQLKTSKPGSTGPEITGVGFGAWAIGGGRKFGWADQKRAAGRTPHE